MKFARSFLMELPKAIMTNGAGSKKVSPFLCASPTWRGDIYKSDIAYRIENFAGALILIGSQRLFSF
jgi:hypothetical protein